MLDPTIISQLIEAVYAAATSPDLWADTLGLICNVLDSSAAVLFATGGKTQDLLFAQTVGLPPEGLADYITYYLGFSPPVRVCAANPDIPYFFGAMPGAKESAASGVTRAGLAAYGFPYYIGAQWALGAAALGYVAFQRTRRQGHVTSDQIALFERLLPHIRRGLAISHRFGDAASRLEASRNIMEHLPYAVVTLDGQGTVLSMNLAASAIVFAGDGIAAERNRLAIRHRTTASSFARLVAHATNVDSSVGRSIAVPRPSGERDYIVTVLPLNTKEAAFAPSRPAAVVLIADPQAVAPVPAESLRAIFGLTPVEARLAALLASGLDLGNCAAQLGITRETARGYLKAVFSKTDTRRQAELVRLLLLTPPGANKDVGR